MNEKGEEILSVDSNKYRYEYSPIYYTKIRLIWVARFLVGIILGIFYFLIYSFFYLVGVGVGFWGVLKLFGHTNTGIGEFVKCAIGLIK